MRIGSSIRTRLASAAVALPTAAAMFVTGAPPAHAVDPGTVLAATKAAYEAYKKFAGGQLTLDAATTQIIGAIDGAKADIIAQIDLVAAAEVRACARSAVINVADIRLLTPDNRQVFALNTTSCATLAEAYLGSSQNKVAVDQLGFALDLVGPVALLARTYANLSVGGLKQTLVGANNTVVAKLTPSCSAHPLWGDAQEGGMVEVTLICTAFNGKRGWDAVYLRLRRGQPLPLFNYSTATNRAMVGTSYPVAIASLASLNS